VISITTLGRLWLEQYEIDHKKEIP
jgi:hypothetical protein